MSTDAVTLLTFAEAAARLGVDEADVKAWIASGRVPVIAPRAGERTGPERRLTMADVERLDRARERIMQGRRFNDDSADLLHEARREAGRE